MNHITEFFLAHGALILFLMTFLEQAGMPLPSAPWLLAGGALAATGRIDLLAAIWWAAMGCLAADTLWFYAGYRGKARLLQLFLQRDDFSVVEVQSADGGKNRERGFARGRGTLRKARTAEQHARGAFAELCKLRSNASTAGKAREVHSLEVHGKPLLRVANDREPHLRDVKDVALFGSGIMLPVRPRVIESH